MTSLTPIGTPCSGAAARPAVERARLRAARARDRRCAKACTTGSRAAMRARQSRTTASAVNLAAAMPRAISVAESSLSAAHGVANWHVRLVMPALVAGIHACFWQGVGGCAAGHDDSSSSRASRRGAGDLAEHRAGDEAGAARIVEVEQAADQLAGRIEARGSAGSRC